MFTTARPRTLTHRHTLSKIFTSGNKSQKPRRGPQWCSPGTQWSSSPKRPEVSTAAKPAFLGLRTRSPCLASGVRSLTHLTVTSKSFLTNIGAGGCHIFLKKYGVYLLFPIPNKQTQGFHRKVLHERKALPRGVRKAAMPPPPPSAPWLGASLGPGLSLGPDQAQPVPVTGHSSFCLVDEIPKSTVQHLFDRGKKEAQRGTQLPRIGRDTL